MKRYPGVYKHDGWWQDKNWVYQSDPNDDYYAGDEMLACIHCGCIVGGQTRIKQIHLKWHER